MTLCVLANTDRYRSPDPALGEPNVDNRTQVSGLEGPGGRGAKRLVHVCELLILCSKSAISPAESARGERQQRLATWRSGSLNAGSYSLCVYTVYIHIS